jgi:hypothetical protein
MTLALKTEAHKTPGMVTFTPTSAVTAGIPQVVGGRIAIPLRDIAANVTDELADRGRFRGVKANEAWVAGDQVGYNSTGNPAVGTAGSGCWTVDKTAWDAGTPAAGIVEIAAAAGAEQGVFILNPDYMPVAGSGAIVAASSAVTNTVAETAFDKTKVIPANSLKVGDRIKFRAQAIATATNSTDTLNLKLRVGGTTILATGAVDVANNDIGYIEGEVTVRTIGAGGTMVAAGVTALGASGTVTAKAGNLPSTALNTTVANTVDVTATWSVANAGNSVRLDVLDLDVIRT